MDYNKLAELLFPNVTKTPADMEQQFQAMADVVKKYA